MNNNIAILEFRPGPGGDEAKIWANDLMRMYTRYANSQGYKVQQLGDDVLKIKGENVFTKLQYESGVHRVQRIPTTERHGRIHTSTATVAVIPEIPEHEVVIRDDDLDWAFYRSSGAGGQNVNKVSSAVRLTHKPTNTVVTCQTERDQFQNRQVALSLLRGKLWEREQEKKAQALGDARSAIGRAMRAEKIRTYNYPQNRVTDHRIKKKFGNLEGIVDGKLDKLIKKLNEQK